MWVVTSRVSNSGPPAVFWRSFRLTAAKCLRLPRQPDCEALGVGAAQNRLPPQIRSRQRVVLKQPKHAAFDLLEDSHPAVEYIGHDLETVIEAREDECVPRQPDIRPRDGQVRAQFAAIGIVGEGQTGDLLGEEFAGFVWDHDPIGDDVVDSLRTHGAGRAEIVHLHRCRGSRAFGIARQIDQNVDLGRVDKARNLCVGHASRVDKSRKCRLKPPPHRRTVIRSDRNRGDVKARRVVTLKYLRHQERHRVLTEIGGHVVEFNSLIRRDFAGPSLRDGARPIPVAE
jgi:hypothetical protein